MSSFLKLCKLIIEDNTSFSCLGSTNYSWDADGTNIDYAKGDNRIPKILGTKKKSKKNKKTKIKILRRNFK